MTGTTVAEAIRLGARRLASIAENPRLEARLLLAHSLGMTQNELIRDLGVPIETFRYFQYLGRRELREPIALIVGHREFWSMDFEVSPATLIPRADSETLIMAALEVFAGREPPERVLDLGTGTGCLLLALLMEFGGVFGIGVDVAPDAVVLARRNAQHLGLDGRSAFFCGNWIEAIGGRFDLIVCNPPYISYQEMIELMPEVADYEPRRALSGGADGYDAYRVLLPRLSQSLQPGGTAILEVGAGQADDVGKIARGCGFTVSFRSDLAGIARACIVSTGLD